MTHSLDPQACCAAGAPAGNPPAVLHVEGCAEDPLSFLKAWSLKLIDSRRRRALHGGSPVSTVRILGVVSESRDWRFKHMSFLAQFFALDLADGSSLPGFPVDVAAGALLFHFLRSCSVAPFPEGTAHGMRCPKLQSCKKLRV